MINGIILAIKINLKLYLMKKYLFIFGSFFTIFFSVNAQNNLKTPTIPLAFLGINNYKVLINGNGILFYNLEINVSQSEIPKGSGIASLFTGSLWIAGIDENNLLHSSCDEYNSGVFDNGPVSNQYDSTYYNKYNSIFPVSKWEINYHIAHHNDTDYTISSNIANWPGNGDTTNGETYYMAPYVDVNGNNRYDPENGDYPNIRGDEALYFIYNDRQDIDTNKMGVEIHCMVYEYSDTSIRNNTFFINYNIINKSQHTYHDVYFGIFTDFDIGNSTDDYILTDTSRNCMMGYNGDDNDSDGYENHPPAQAFVSLNHSFCHTMYFINDSSGVMNDPTTPEEYYNYMRGYWKDSTRLEYGGNGHLSGGDITNFAFDINSGWTENDEELPPNDIRGVGSFGPYTLNPEEHFCMDIAYPWARTHDSTAYYSTTILQHGIDEIKNWYDSQNFNCDMFTAASFGTVSYSTKTKIICFPNPTKDYITIKTPDKNFSVEIFDILGHCIFKQKDSKIINIQTLHKGIYLMMYISDNKMIPFKIVKE